MRLKPAVRCAFAFLVLALFATACSDGSTEPDSSSTDSTSDDNALTANSPDDAVAATNNAEAVPGSVSTTIAPAEIEIAGADPAPEFPAGVEWLNVSRPLSMAQDLRGKFVLLDFWTQGCINCIHVIPDLKRLEAEFPDELVVVGVHWAKFDRERQIDAVRDSVLRYGLEHPIVNDATSGIAASYGANAWPTFVLIDPAGNILGRQSGEGIYEPVATLLGRAIGQWDAAGLLDRRSLADVIATESAAPTILSFPGKVLADVEHDRLFVADSGHHRILVSDLNGRLSVAIGDGTEGFVDGPAGSARFSRPQGLALSPDGNMLYVADRENHAIRSVDLRSMMVSTIAGTGDNAYLLRPGDALTSPVPSPWDLEVVGDQLLIAGAGRHQIYRIDLPTNTIEVYAGNGGEGIQDGPRLSTTLSQPSGFATDGTTLWFTDPEASAVRRVPASGDADAELDTLVGDGLFTWGNQVGTFDETLLQHAVGIELVNDRLVIADTYNHQLKVLEPAASLSLVWSGDGVAGYVDGAAVEARFNEPSGLSLGDGLLYVADTNNHQIRLVDLDTGDVDTLEFTNLDIASITVEERLRDRVEVAPSTLTEGLAQLLFDFDIPAGYKLNQEGTFTLTWSDRDGGTTAGAGEFAVAGPELPVVVEINVSESAIIDAEVLIFYCLDDNEAFCLIRTINYEIPIELGSGRDATSELTIVHDLPTAEEIEAR